MTALVVIAFFIGQYGTTWLMPQNFGQGLNVGWNPGPGQTYTETGVSVYVWPSPKLDGAKYKPYEIGGILTRTAINAFESSAGDGKKFWAY